VTVVQNGPLVAALVATVVAQLLKLVIVGASERRFAPDRLLETGGMPSSHSAAVTALALAMGLEQGWSSPFFALAAVLAGIVMYDATGIRRAAGMQAQMINDLVEELGHLFDAGFQPQALKTLLGHTYPQVLVGAVVGFATAMVLAL
jgi:Uncharacterized protein conserved in bacteria